MYMYRCNSYKQSSTMMREMQFSPFENGEDRSFTMNLLEIK